MKSIVKMLTSVTEKCEITADDTESSTL